MNQSANQQVEMTDAGGNVLNFETAMAHFQAMFPDFSAQLIESVLRRHDGNVAQTIEELLERSAGNCPSSSSAVDCQTHCSPSVEDGTKKAGKAVSWAEQTQPADCSKEQRPQRDPCADDEKIALLIQNREFLRYLRQDPHFQRAVVSKHQASARYAQHYPLPSGPALPMLLASSRPSRSPNTGRLFSRPGSQKHLERPQPVPDGPVIEERKKHEELAIPEGPLIDYIDAENRESGWASRLKAKLGKWAPEGSEQLPPSPLVDYSDDQMRKSVQNLLAKGGRGLLEGLAKKFTARRQHQRVRME